MTVPGHEILAPGDLAALMTSPILDGTAGDAALPLCIDLRGGAQAPAADTTRVIAWLRSQNRVVMGLADEAAAHHPLDAGVDVLLAADEQDRCSNAIRANPQAAMVLVEVLRTTEHLPPADALIVESLAYAALQGGAEHAAWLHSERARRAARVVPPRDDMVLLERRNGLLSVCLNSPGTRNSLSAAMRDALTEALTMVAVDPSIGQVVVSGRGPCFSAGGDLKEFGLAPDPATAHRIRLQRMPARYLLLCRDRCEFRLHGACIGAGIELPAFAHRVVARADARFRLPEVAMGLIPGAGGCVSIPRRIGRQRTAYLALTGAEIDAGRALAWGLVDEVVEEIAA